MPIGLGVGLALGQLQTPIQGPPPAAAAWILSGGAWNDAGAWNDNSGWEDNA